MEQPDNVENLGADAPHDGQVPEAAGGHHGTSLIDILRMKEQMFNQCVEMSAQLNAVDSTSEAESNLADSVKELEAANTVLSNSTLPLHRMQMWHAIAEKRKRNDPESDELNTVAERCMALCSQIKTLQQESKEIEDQVTDIQKKRLELKRLTNEKMKEIDEVMSKEHPDMEKHKDSLDKGQLNLEKYKAMTVMTQHVLRGIILGCNINWLDDPKLKDIVMTLDSLPISD